MTVMGEVAPTVMEGRNMLEKIIENGSGARKMGELIEAQNGDPGVVDDLSRLPQSKFKIEAISRESGYVNSFGTSEVGNAALILGAGEIKERRYR